jgi:hypothetical protein
VRPPAVSTARPAWPARRIRWVKETVHVVELTTMLSEISSGPSCVSCRGPRIQGSIDELDKAAQH